MNYTYKDANGATVTLPLSGFRLSEHASVIASAQAAWQVKNPSVNIHVERNACQGIIKRPCTMLDSPGFIPPNGYNTSILPVYEFAVDEKSRDVTSIYTWHIFNTSNGQWLPFTYGPTRQFRPTVAGTYQVSIRQDNLGIQGGVAEYTFPLDIQTDCCGSNDSKMIAAGSTSIVIHKLTKEELQQMEAVYNQSPSPTATSSISSSINIEQESILDTINFMKSIDVYPSPTTGILNLTLNSLIGGPLSIHLTDVLGRDSGYTINTAIPVGLYQSTMDISALPQGMYVLSFIHNGASKYLKVTKD